MKSMVRKYFLNSIVKQHIYYYRELCVRCESYRSGGGTENV